MCTLIEKEIQAANQRNELDFVDILIEINNDYKIDNAQNAVIRNAYWMVLDIYSISDSM